jgi:CheY-like chemotaxis protein
MSELRRILLAENDPRDVELTLKGLAEYRLTNDVFTVNNGEEALDYLFRRGRFSQRPEGLPAVILLDLKMPLVSGLEVLQELKTDERLRQIPVVVLTSSREDHDLEVCYRLGVNAYVVKPLGFPEFVEAVKTIGIFWAVLNEPPLTCGRPVHPT